MPFERLAETEGLQAYSKRFKAIEAESGREVR
jgi:hypothetical protein